jgi:hypothetical protein
MTTYILLIIALVLLAGFAFRAVWNEFFEPETLQEFCNHTINTIVASEIAARCDKENNKLDFYVEAGELTYCIKGEVYIVTETDEGSDWTAPHTRNLAVDCSLQVTVENEGKVIAALDTEAIEQNIRNIIL